VVLYLVYQVDLRLLLLSRILVCGSVLGLEFQQFTTPFLACDRA